MSRSPYDVLGVGRTASQTEIKAAFYKLVKKYHPDVNPGTTEKFKEIHKAYTTLTHTPNYQEEKPFNAGDEYIFRQQSREEFIHRQAEKEREQDEATDQESNPGPTPPKADTWKTEKIVVGVVVLFLGVRLLFAEGGHQQSNRAFQKQFEVSMEEYAREVEQEEAEFEQYVRSRGFSDSIRGR